MHLSGFHRLTPKQRLKAVAGYVPQDTLDDLTQSADLDALDRMTECVVGAFSMPLSIISGVNVNGVDHFAAMVTEEPSVVAAANAASALFSRAGGVRTAIITPTTRAQIMLLSHDANLALQAAGKLQMKQENWLELANSCDPELIKAGGGAQTISFECIQQMGIPEIFIVGNLEVATADAMGANAVNTMAENVLREIMPFLDDEFGHNKFEPGMAILTNASEGRLARARVSLPFEALDHFRKGVDGKTLARRIEEASHFAQASTSRAITHNKGILNGVCACATALGQDTRAISTAAIGYACRSGAHKPLSIWAQTERELNGELCLPLPVGLVGGARNGLKAIDAAFRLAQIDDYETLCGLITSVGLAQNFSALAALMTEGIQAGHMKLHARKNQFNPHDTKK